jgi:hypothetical protein
MDLNELYAQLNEELFGGVLPVIPCLLNGRLRKTLGRCHLRYCRKGDNWSVLKIDIQKALDPTVLRKTMVHEMCHAWAVLTHQERGHGPFFWLMMSACGYPDGHRIAGVSNDAWVRTRDFDFTLGEIVHWNHEGGRYFGRVRAIRKRYLEVLDNRGCLWRVSPNNLSDKRELSHPKAGQSNQ